jgi:hypothetical protein
MACILFHVKFEGRLSISILRNKATQYEKLEFKTDEFSKSSKPPSCLLLGVSPKKRHITYIIHNKYLHSSTVSITTCFYGSLIPPTPTHTLHPTPTGHFCKTFYVGTFLRQRISALWRNRCTHVYYEFKSWRLGFHDEGATPLFLYACAIQLLCWHSEELSMSPVSSFYFPITPVLQLNDIFR